MNTLTVPFPKDGLWTVRLTSEWMSVTELSLHTMLKRREIPAPIIVKIGRQVRFRPDLLRDWVLKPRLA